MKPLAVAVLLMSAATGMLAQSAASGSLSGRLTDLHSKPLQGVAVVVRNQATGAEVRTTTAKNGIYRFSALPPGEYTLEAESPQLGRGRVEEIEVGAGAEARVQTAMEFEPPVPLMDLASAPAPLEQPDAAMPRQAERPTLEPSATLLNDAALTAEAPQQLPVAAQSLPRTAPEKTAGSVSAGGNPSQVAEAKTEKLIIASVAERAARPTESSTKPPAVEARALTPAQAAPAQSQGAVESTAIQTPPPAAVPSSPQKNPQVAAPESTTLSAQQLQALPASGRRWQEFVLDSAAATTGGVAESQGTASAVGQQAKIAVDGVGQRLAFGSTSGSRQGAEQGGAEAAGGLQVWAGGHGLGVSEAAIREVQTAASSVEAESARASGNRMNVETQSGANGLHGQGFLFDRQNIWGAQNPFTQWVKETTQGTGTNVPVFGNGPNGTPESYTPPDHETVWGLGAGSQLRRDKLFWFAALDSYNRNDPGISTVKHPYLLKTLSNCVGSECTETVGFFAQPSSLQMQMLCTRMGLTGQGPSGIPYCPLDKVTAAYSEMLENLAGLLGPALRTATQWTGFSRFDWQAAERHHFTVEAIGARWNAPGGGLTNVSENYGSHSFGSSLASEEWLLGRWEAFVTPNFLLVTQGSAGRTIEEERPDTPSDFEKQFLKGNAWGQLPQIVVDNRYGFTIGNPSRFGQGSYPDERLGLAEESLDWVRGSLLVKAGFQASRNADTTGLLRNQTGTYTYANVVNFTTDAWDFENGIGEFDSNNQHNCDAAGTGFGNLPCYTSYSQTMGPTDWHLSTVNWAGFGTAQWEVTKRLVLSAGLRMEREERPPSIAALDNPALPLTEKMPALGNNWGPRLSLAWQPGERQKLGWPVVRLGYGMYFGRTENLTLETALTQTGSLKGDLKFFMRPTDNLNAGGAPPFPHVLAGQPGSAIKPGAVEFAPIFRNPEIHQGEVALEETLPGGVLVTASAEASLGRRLPISVDSNLNPAAVGTITYEVCDENATSSTCGFTGLGPIKAPKITVPFYASWPSTTESAGDCPTPYIGWTSPCYQQIDQLMSRANSTYEAAELKVARYGRHGLSLHARYTYAHAMDWNPNESAQVASGDILDPADFNLEYGVSNLDMRHSASVMVMYEAPWKLHGAAGILADGWMISGVGHFHGGLPYTMRTSGYLPECYVTSGVTACNTTYAGINATTGAAIVGLGPGMNGSGGDNRIYGMGSDGHTYNIGRNTYRYPATWKIDLRLAKRFDLGNMRQLELLAESFNLLNHQNVTELETTGYTIESGSATNPYPTLNYLTGLKTNTTAFGQPLNINATDFYRERQIQLGMRVRF